MTRRWRRDPPERGAGTGRRALVDRAGRRRGRAGAVRAARTPSSARLIAPVADQYDHVFLDCPPSLGLLTVNALTAADGTLDPDPMRVLRARRSDTARCDDQSRSGPPEPRLAIEGVVLTMFDGRTNLSARGRGGGPCHLGDPVFETVIPRSVRLSEAPSHGQPIHLYAPASAGATAYQALAAEYRNSRRGALRAAASAQDPDPRPDGRPDGRDRGPETTRG